MNLQNKYTKLFLGMIFDLVGLIPAIDIVWAPLSAYLIAKMYPGKKGKLAAFFSFVEEVLPFADIIPTFTIMWLYTYVFEKKRETVIGFSQQ
ncbi:MAG: hypothetical protein KDC56_07800 [Flavobacteriaceae bacterium]|nr:hypothetical protein [Flavobacteriaceae bacterium]